MQAGGHGRPGPYQAAGAYGSEQSNAASFHCPSPSSHQQDADPGTEQPHRLHEGLDLGRQALICPPKSIACFSQNLE